jgi:hypothetical protein
MLVVRGGSSERATGLNIGGSNASSGKRITSSATDAARHWNPHIFLEKRTHDHSVKLIAQLHT